MPPNELAQRLRRAFSWRDGHSADPSGWWRDPDLLREIVAALAQLHPNAAPTVVLGIASRGSLLGPLVAQHLGIGFVEVLKHFKHEGDTSPAYLHRATPPDYAQRDLLLAIRRQLIGPRDRVLLVDDWITTGAQASAAARLVDDCGAEFVGAAVIVDQTTGDIRHSLNVRSLVNVHALSW